MSMPPSAGRVRTTYELIKAHRGTFSVQALCRVLDVAPSGYYAWLQQPLSCRAQDDARLLRLIRASFVASQGIYGADFPQMEPTDQLDAPNRRVPESR